MKVYLCMYVEKKNFFSPDHDNFKIINTDDISLSICLELNE